MLLSFYMQKKVTFVLIIVKPHYMQIQHLRHSEIDFERWDVIIAQSKNQLGYAYSWYLDIVSPGWEALVSNNYEFVMPLPVKRKFGIPYIVQPILTQQLGVFSALETTHEIIQFFIKKIPYYSYEINLNEGNFNKNIIPLPNYVLNLNESYESIAKRYSKNTIRNIVKTQKEGLVLRNNLNIIDFIDFYNSVDKKFISINSGVLKKLLERAIEKKAINLMAVENKNNEIIAALCLFQTGNRLVYLLPISNHEGKKSSAMFMLVDYLIKSRAQSNLNLDFEGSLIDGIARFYKGFGAKNHPYYLLKRFRPTLLIGKL